MIDELLDNDGYGVLTSKLEILFTANGCKPFCHICSKFIVLDSKFRLKPFVTEISERTYKTTLTVMVCENCDISDKKLPYEELVTALENLKIIVPKYVRYQPGDDKKEFETLEKSFNKYYRPLLKKCHYKVDEIDKEAEMLQWRKTWRTSDGNSLTGFEEYTDFTLLNSFHDLPYFLDVVQYEKGVEKLNRKFVQGFSNETYAERSIRSSKEHAQYVKSLPKRGGCFVLSVGGENKIIS